MAVPSAIAAQLTALNSAITAAGSLTTASFSTLNALAYQAQTLASAVEAAIPTYAGQLDTWIAPTPTASILSGILAIQDDCLTQLSLADLEGYAARITINLENR